MSGIITYGGNQYRFKGFFFEIHKYCGPCPLKKNGDPSVAKPSKLFWEVVSEFCRLPEAEQKKHMAWESPGCVHF